MFVFCPFSSFSLLILSPRWWVFFIHLHLSSPHLSLFLSLIHSQICTMLTPLSPQPNKDINEAASLEPLISFWFYPFFSVNPSHTVYNSSLWPSLPTPVPLRLLSSFSCLCITTFFSPPDTDRRSPTSSLFPTTSSFQALHYFLRSYVILAELATNNSYFHSC